MFKGGLYLAIGDSVTWCNYESGATGTDLYATKIADSIRANYGNIKHINKGLGGNDSTELLNNLYWYARMAPDLVTIAIGMNDCASQAIPVATYQSNLSAIIDKLRQKNPNVVIILCAPSGTTSSTRTSYIADYRTAMQTVATSKNVAFCNFTATGGVTDANAATYTTDGIHPNKTGHTMLYNLLYPVIQNAAANWLNTLGK